MINVLILGSEGFLGTHLRDVLLSDNLITLTTFDFNESSYENHIRDSINNITDYASVLHNQDVIIDLIGLSGASADFSNFKKYINVNIESLLEILDVCKGSEKEILFLFPSSRLVYAITDTEIPIDENHSVDPRSLYGITKLTGEQIIRSFCRINKKIKYMIFRISIPYGLGYNAFARHGIVNMFIHHARNGMDIPIYGDGLQVRDIINVVDVAKIIRISIYNSKLVFNDTLNIGGVEHYPLIEIAKIAIKLSGSTSKIISTPWPDSQLQVETGNMVLSNEKIKNKYGFHDFMLLDESILSYMNNF